MNDVLLDHANTTYFLSIIFHDMLLLLKYVLFLFIASLHILLYATQTPIKLFRHQAHG